MRMGDELGNCQVRLPSSRSRFSLATWQLGLYSVAAYMLGGGPRCSWQIAKHAANDDPHEPKRRHTMRES